jgi:hypothetical protein
LQNKFCVVASLLQGLQLNFLNYFCKVVADGN